jgi:hypothetical protein
MKTTSYLSKRTKSNHQRCGRCVASLPGWKRGTARQASEARSKAGPGSPQASVRCGVTEDALRQTRGSAGRQAGLTLPPGPRARHGSSVARLNREGHSRTGTAPAGKPSLDAAGGERADASLPAPMRSSRGAGPDPSRSRDPVRTARRAGPGAPGVGHT